MPISNMTAAMLISPEPQIPLGRTLPMVTIMGSSVAGSREKSSIAPSAARMPKVRPPPSNAGPAEQAAQASQSRLPITISALVPTSRIERQVFGSVDPGAHDPGHDVPAHIARHARVHQGCDVLAQLHADIPGFDGGVQGGGRDVGRAPDGPRVDPQQQLGHGGVAGQGDRRDVLGVDPGAPHDLAQNAVDGPDHHLLQAIETAGLFGVHDARDDILAVADLAVELGVLGQHLARDQVNDLAVDGRGPDVHGDGEAAAAGIARLQVDQAVAPVRPHRPDQGGCDSEIPLSQHRRDLADQREVHPQAVLVVHALEVLNEAAEVGQVVAGRGRGEFEVLFFDRRQKKPLLLQVRPG